MTIFRKVHDVNDFHIRKEKEGGRNFHKVSNKRLQSWDCLFKLTTDLLSILFKLHKKKQSLSLLKLFVSSSTGLSKGFNEAKQKHDNKKVVFKNTWESVCLKLNSKHVFFLIVGLSRYCLPINSCTLTKLSSPSMDTLPAS